MSKNYNESTAVKGDAPKKRRGILRWFKELFSELKKVTWPSFATVLKQTGIVLLVTASFLLVLMLIDAGLGQLYNLLLKGLDSESVLFDLLSPAAVKLPHSLGGVL